MNAEYPFKTIEKKWQETWDREDAFGCDVDSDTKKFYCLEMFPYPSGNLHMGHVRNYAIGDAIARYKLMNGFNVLHPMGWDAFGLPAENAAIERSIHPRDWTFKNIKMMRIQLKQMGYAIDWSREVATCHPEYYRWCQWLFLRMYEKGLAYRKTSSVNWCESCRTVLANEQVENGTCWRCHNIVKNKELEGWFLKITDYAEELLEDHDRLTDGWPERVLTMQKHWIGRSEGAWVHFPLESTGDSIEVFTTRPDTLYGATFMVMAPENPLALSVAPTEDKRRELRAFSDQVRNTDIIDRTDVGIPKEGLFTGAYATNPLTTEKIPIWVSDFVLMEYGTGAIMSVPAHDQRDFEFARKYNLPIRVVITPDGESFNSDEMTEAFEAVGKMVNSGPFDGMNSDEGILRITEYIESEKIGHKAVTYRLRDWGISRQRYWGTPIPIVYCKSCGTVPVDINDLPVVLPADIEFDWAKGGNPLARCKSFVDVDCPTCGGPAVRDTDTMDTFIDSSWYFTRYTSPRDRTCPANPDNVNYWMPVDQYIGGIEHAVMHLLYARFFTKMMRDIGLTDVNEPFSRLLTQGMVCLEVMQCEEHGYLYPGEATDMGDGSFVCSKCGSKITLGRSEKMSKSKRNTKEPEVYLNRYGADTIRVFSLFASPPEKDLDWSDSGVEGVYRFLKRIWRLAFDWREVLENSADSELDFSGESNQAADLIRQKTHATIKRVTGNFETRYHFNTSISACMELVNVLNLVEQPPKDDPAGPAVENAMVESFRSLVKMINPFAPHIAEELWQFLGNKTLLVRGSWPEYNESIAAFKTIVIPVQVNGRVRTRFEVEVDTPKERLEEMVRDDELVKKWAGDKSIRKVIIIPNRLINVVIS